MIEKENTVSSDLVYTGKTISLRVDTVEVPNKGYQKREIVEHQGAVAIVALTDDDKVVLIKQFRKPIEQVIWEIPAGKLEIGENPKDCAIRELKEELGIEAKEEECNLVKSLLKNRLGMIWDIYFLRKDVELEDVTLQKEEVSRVKLVNTDEFRDMLKEGIMCEYSEVYELLDIIDELD